MVIQLIAKLMKTGASAEDILAAAGATPKSPEAEDVQYSELVQNDSLLEDDLFARFVEEKEEQKRVEAANAELIRSNEEFIAKYLAEQHARAAAAAAEEEEEEEEVIEEVIDEESEYEEIEDLSEYDLEGLEGDFSEHSVEEEEEEEEVIEDDDDDDNGDAPSQRRMVRSTDEESEVEDASSQTASSHGDESTVLRGSQVKTSLAQLLKRDQVVERGLLSEEQADEMLTLPIHELMGIMQELTKRGTDEYPWERLEARLDLFREEATENSGDSCRQGDYDWADNSLGSGYSLRGDYTNCESSITYGEEEDELADENDDDEDQEDDS